MVVMYGNPAYMGSLKSAFTSFVKAAVPIVGIASSTKKSAAVSSLVKKAIPAVGIISTVKQSPGALKSIISTGVPGVSIMQAFFKKKATGGSAIQNLLVASKTGGKTQAEIDAEAGAIRIAQMKKAMDEMPKNPNYLGPGLMKDASGNVVKIPTDAQGNYILPSSTGGGGSAVPATTTAENPLQQYLPYLGIAAGTLVLVLILRGRKSDSTNKTK